ncbi:MAG: four helix bundle protein [bacterium]|nr:four helix bundle protein [bacterium]
MAIQIAVGSRESVVSRKMQKQRNGYKDLIVWQKSVALVVLVYAFTDDFPKEEMYGLSSQMKRAGVSIPSNIAEGSRRGTTKDFKQFLSIAYGSAAELETQLEIAKRLGFGKKEKGAQVAVLLEEVLRMLNGMLKSESVVGSR